MLYVCTDTGVVICCMCVQTQVCVHCSDMLYVCTDTGVCAADGTGPGC